MVVDEWVDGMGDFGAIQYTQGVSLMLDAVGLMVVAAIKQRLITMRVMKEKEKKASRGRVCIL